MEIAKNSIVVIDGTDLSCYFNSIEIASDKDSHDVTTFCTDGNRAVVGGLKEKTVSGEGFWSNEGDKNVADLFKNLFNDEEGRIMTITHGNAVGSSAAILNTLNTNYSTTASVGDLLLINFESKVTSGAWSKTGKTDGVLLMNTVTDETVNGASFDAGATAFDSYAGDGWIAHFHVLKDGDASYSSIEITLQHSTDNSTWVDFADLELYSDSYGEQMNGEETLNRYRRAIVSAFSGTDPVRVIVALARGN